MTGGEYMPDHDTDENAVLTIGDAAEGTIEAAGDQLRRLEEFLKRLGCGEFHRPPQIPDLAACVDGRQPESGTGQLVANAAGGTLTYFAADDLTGGRITGEGSSLASFTRMADYLQAKGVALGDHTDSHAADGKTGCGANDRLPEIYGYIARRGDVLSAWTAKLGVNVSDETHALITGRARARTDFSPPSAITAALRERTTPELVPELQGDHREIAVVVNLRDNTTLDRAALAESYGPDMQAFNVDAWKFWEAAAGMAESEAEADQMTIAMMYYNLATAFVLVGPDMQAVVVK